MKKIFTLTVLALFMSLSAMADWSLGNLAYNIQEGATVRMSKVMKSGIKVTFPEVTDNQYSDVFLSAVLTPETGDAILLQGVAGTYKDGVVFKDFDELQNDMKYTFKITYFTAGGDEEIAWEEGSEPTLTFFTKTAERKLKWDFRNTTDDITAIKASIDNNEGLWNPSSKDRFAIAKSYDYEEVMLDANTILPITADLYIKCAGDQMLVGSPSNSSYNRLQFNGKRSFLIPDCVKGDEIYIKATRAAKKSPWLQVINGECEDGKNEAKDSVALGSSNVTYKFVMQADGDVQVNVNNACLLSIEIIPGNVEKKKYTYSVVAKDPEGNILKTFVPETIGVERDVIKGNYSYWMKTADGKLVTYGTKGNPFSYSFTLQSDTIFVLDYTDTQKDGVVYLSEAEDIEGAVICTNANSEIRSSNCKAAHFEADTKICTLQPGTYKICAVVFDAQKTTNYIAKFNVGETAYELAATSTNFTEAETSLIEVTEPTDVTIAAGGDDKTGLDIIAIYASTDSPEPEPGEDTGINDVTVSGNAKAKKMVRNGQIIIVKGNNEYNAVGSQIK